MAHARTVLPTDLVALVSYDGRVYSNEAVTLDRLGTQDSPHPLETALEQWFSFATGRHTCVSVKGATLRGLVSARKRGSKHAWEIDCLIDAADDDDAVLLSLLDRMVDAAGRSGALKVFLRHRRGSGVEAAAHRSGFMAYRRECVYHRATREDDTHHPAAGLRRRGKGDPYPIFQLSNALVPAEIRRIEGMTFDDWTASQESLGRTAQYVLDGERGVRGWLRVAGDGEIGRLDVLGEREALDELIGGGLAKLAKRKNAYIAAPEHQPLLAERLRDHGFEPADEYVVTARRTVRPVRQRAKVPALVQTTFG